MITPSRRAFTFASLALAAGFGDAAAAGPVGPPPVLRASWAFVRTRGWIDPARTFRDFSVVRGPGQLDVWLTVVNGAEGRIHLDPSTDMSVDLVLDDGPISLAGIGEVRRRIQVALPRDGTPMRNPYVPLEPGVPMKMMVRRFTLPEGAEVEPVAAIARVHVNAHGLHVVELRSGTVAPDSSAVNT